MILQKEYFSKECDNVLSNITVLESFFDCWCNIGGFANPTQFLESFMSFNHADGKIIVDTRYKVDIFEDCIHSQNIDISTAKF